MQDKNVKTFNDLAEVLQSLSDEEKKQAYALLQGIVIGKELAKQQKQPA